MVQYSSLESRRNSHTIASDTDNDPMAKSRPISGNGGPHTMEERSAAVTSGGRVRHSGWDSEIETVEGIQNVETPLVTLQ